MQVAHNEAEYQAEQGREARLRFTIALVRWMAALLLICEVIYEFFAFSRGFTAGTSFGQVGTWLLLGFALLCIFTFVMVGSLRE